MKVNPLIHANEVDLHHQYGDEGIRSYPIGEKIGSSRSEPYSSAASVRRPARALPFQTAAIRSAHDDGPAGGVARALLPMLIGDGYRVALIGVNAIGLGKMAAEHGDNVVALPCNLTDLPALTAALEKARAAFGTLDLLINNAGVTTTEPFVDIDPASIPRDIGINLVAPLHIIHTVAPWMRSPGDREHDLAGLDHPPCLATVDTGVAPRFLRRVNAYENYAVGEGRPRTLPSTFHTMLGV
jgi:hypothetical protein